MGMRRRKCTNGAYRLIMVYDFGVLRLCVGLFGFFLNIFLLYKLFIRHECSVTSITNLYIILRYYRNHNGSNQLNLFFKIIVQNKKCEENSLI